MTWTSGWGEGGALGDELGRLQGLFDEGVGQGDPVVALRDLVEVADIEVVVRLPIQLQDPLDLGEGHLPGRGAAAAAGWGAAGRGGPTGGRSRGAGRAAASGAGCGDSSRGSPRPATTSACRSSPATTPPALSSSAPRRPGRRAWGPSSVPLCPHLRPQPGAVRSLATTRGQIMCFLQAKPPPLYAISGL